MDEELVLETVGGDQLEVDPTYTMFIAAGIMNKVIGKSYFFYVHV